MLSQEFVLFIYIPLPVAHQKVIKKLRKELGHDPIIKQAHITLYMCRFERASYKLLIKSLYDTELNKFSVNIDRLTFTPSKNGGKFCSIKIKGKSLQKIHEQIVSIANPLRNNLIRSKELQRVKDDVYSKKEIELLYKYGYVEVMENYRPHITIGDNVSVNAQLKKSSQSKVNQLDKTIAVQNIIVSFVKIGKKDYKTIFTRTFKLKSKI